MAVSSTWATVLLVFSSLVGAASVLSADREDKRADLYLTALYGEVFANFSTGMRVFDAQEGPLFVPDDLRQLGPVAAAQENDEPGGAAGAAKTTPRLAQRMLRNDANELRRYDPPELLASSDTGTAASLESWLVAQTERLHYSGGDGVLSTEWLLGR